jgi:hypothetical protein
VTKFIGEPQWVFPEAAPGSSSRAFKAQAGRPLQMASQELTLTNGSPRLQLLAANTSGRDQCRSID